MNSSSIIDTIPLEQRRVSPQEEKLLKAHELWNLTTKFRFIVLLAAVVLSYNFHWTGPISASLLVGYEVAKYLYYGRNGKEIDNALYKRHWLTWEKNFQECHDIESKRYVFQFGGSYPREETIFQAIEDKKDIIMYNRATYTQPYPNITNGIRVLAYNCNSSPAIKTSPLKSADSKLHKVEGFQKSS